MPRLRHYNREQGFVTIIEGGPSATVSYEAVRDFKKWKMGQASFSPRAEVALQTVKEKLDLDEIQATALLADVAENVA